MKARLKTIFLSAISVISAFSFVTLTSCDDKCKTISCAYGGICNEGKCLCKSGYEGPQCETLMRKKFLDTWVVTETGTITDSRQYSLVIEGQDGNESGVRIKNFYNNNLSAPVNAFVRNGDTLTIGLQTIDKYSIVGEGWIQDEKYYGDNGQIILRYKITNNETGEIDDFGYDRGEPSLWNK